MKLLIDSANLEEIRAAASWGIIDGVTTNPTLASKEKGDFKTLVKKICRLVNGPVSVEAISLKTDKIIEEAKKLAAWHKNVVVKIPCTIEGLKATKILHRLKIPTNVTLVFSPNQVLLAAKAGATYISPFVGRLEDAGKDGMAMIAESLRIIENYKFSSQIIVASVRSTAHCQRAATLGAPIATVPFKILKQLFFHPLTDKGIQKFLEDWKKKVRKS